MTDVSSWTSYIFLRLSKMIGCVRYTCHVRPSDTSHDWLDPVEQCNGSIGSFLRTVGFSGSSRSKIVRTSKNHERPRADMLVGLDILLISGKLFTDKCLSEWICVSKQSTRAFSIVKYRYPSPMWVAHFHWGRGIWSGNFKRSLAQRLPS